MNNFEQLKISLVKHDDSHTGLPCYIEVQLNSMPKDKGSLVLDLGNYIYRNLGLSYQMPPEFRGGGKKTTLRWFMSWKDLAPVLPNLKQAFGIKHMAEVLPVEFQSLIIQDTACGVFPNGDVS